MTWQPHLFLFRYLGEQSHVRGIFHSKERDNIPSLPTPLWRVHPGCDGTFHEEDKNQQLDGRLQQK